MQEASEYELIKEDGVRLVSLVLGFTVHVAQPLSSHGEAVLRLYEQFLAENAASGVLRFYATETMRQHKSIAKSTFGMLPTWLKAGAPAREYLSIELKDGVHHQDAPHCKFEIYSIEQKSALFGRGRANMLSVSMALTDDAEVLLRFRDQFLEACRLLPTQSAIGGLRFECARYEKEVAQTAAWTRSMHAKGVDICRIPEDARAVGTDGLKGVGWLTTLGADALEKVGGTAKLRKALPKEVEMFTIGTGAALQLGPSPLTGDLSRGEDLSLYRAVYRQLAPLIRLAGSRSIAFNLATDYVERTEQWFNRLAHE